MRAPVLFTPQQRISSDDGLVRAIELVLTPLAFAGIGWLLDRALGTTPWLLIVLPAVAFVGKVIAEWYRYDHRMKGHEARLTADRPTHARSIDVADDAPDHLPTGVTLDEDLA